MAGKKHSEEAKAKMTMKQQGELNSFYGKKHSEETKMKMRMAKVNVPFLKIIPIEIN